MDNSNFNEDELQSIAIIGMAMRFPGADTVAQYWQNLAEGLEAIVDVEEDELLKLGVPKSLLTKPSYIKRSGRLDNVAGFDASFFGIAPMEAELMDPQHRLLLECAYESIEYAGYNPFAFDVPVGVYTGVSLSDYLIANIVTRPDLMEQVNGLQILVGNDKSYASTRISHKLGLRGPSLSIDSACSTSLVCIHHACKALLSYECEYAIAGAAKVSVPHGIGYIYQEGGILSSDGHCRPFDSSANGTIHSNGVGVVLLKRLVDAVKDRDTIYAVIRGSAVNNDGANKIGYTAPSVSGQADVVAEALAVANLDAGQIDYIEAHGTGTHLGDPIEIRALAQVFSESGNQKSRCAIGSVKGNIGHLDVAAGMSSLIKTTMALKNKKIPPSLNYRKANSEINFLALPFYVAEELKEWPSKNGKRYAGVSSFGIGGTNAHLVLEQAPERTPLNNSRERDFHILCLSSQSNDGLREYQSYYQKYCQDSAEALADVAYTANNGRPHFAYRKAYIGKNISEICARIDDEVRRAPRLDTNRINFAESAAKIAFLFAGQGTQYTGMARQLYTQSPVFRDYFDEIAHSINQHLIDPVESIIWGDHTDGRIDETYFTQPTLFAIELALAKTWQFFGVTPEYVIGHSLGEVVAACFAGILNVDDAAKLVVARANAMAAATEGAMLAVALPLIKVRALLDEHQSVLEIAANNSLTNVVVSGAINDIVSFEEILSTLDIKATRLKVNRAFHSSLMESVMENFKAAISDLRFNTPNIKVVSNVNVHACADSMCSPDYWVKHIRQTVNFKEGVEWLFAEGVNVFLEVGPQPTLIRFAQNCLPNTKALWLKSGQKDKNDWEVILASMAEYYECGGNINWHAFDEAYSRQRIQIPTYPFQRKLYWSLKGQCPQMIEKPMEGAQEQDVQFDQVVNESQSLNELVLPKTTRDLYARVKVLWQEVLGIAHIADEDDFFELGGHSLLLLQLNQRLTIEFNTVVPAIVLVENSRLNTFCQALTFILSQAETSEAFADEHFEQVVADFDNCFEPFPLTSLQQAFLVGRSSDFGLGGVSTHLYFESQPSAFDYQRFCDSFNALIQRHNMLRAVVIDEQEQRILEDVGYYNIRHYAPGSIDALNGHLDSLRAEMSHQVMPANQWPLFDVRVTTKPDGQAVLHFSIDLLMLDVHSNQIIFRDLDLLYAGKTADLSTLAMNYRDYILAEKRFHSGRRYEDAKSYWLSRIPNMALAPDLPLVKNPAEIQSPTFTRRVQELDLDTSRLLRTTAQRMGITPSVLLISAYGFILSRWSKRAEFTLNLTMFSRLPLHECVNDVVGDFTTLILLALDYSGFECFKTMSRNIQKQLWNDSEHQSFDGVQVMRELTRHYGGEHQVTMPVVFTSALPLDEGMGDTIIENSLMEGMDESFSISQTPQVWIDHVAAERDGHIILSWDSIDELFLPGMLDDMFAQYTQLVSQLAQDESIWQKTRIDTLPTEQRRRRDRANDTHAPLNDKTLIDSYLTQLQLRPSTIAVINGNETFTYEEFHRRVLYWVNWLVEKEIKRGDSVAVVMEKGWQQPVAAVAIQMAGAAYIAVDVALPEHRRDAILQHAQVRIVLTQKPYETLFSQITTIEEIGVIEAELFVTSMQHKEILPSPDDLAYVLFTSGSTGTPKGVVIDHRSATNTMLDIIERFSIKSTDRVLAVSSLSFDLSVLDIFGVLAAGGSLVIPYADEIRDPESLDRLVNKHQITLINTVPAMVQSLVDYHEINGSRFSHSLRLIMMCGDFIPTSLPGRIRALCQADVQLKSMGGPTETAIYSVSYDIAEVDPNWRSIPYGKALRNRKCWVMDDDYNDRPDGVAGEIFIGGNNCLAVGYWRNETLTAEKFVHHPLTGERMFKTSDLGQYLGDGNIEILGRRDFQVKVNGFRVELGEIEAIIGRNENVKQVAVTAKTNDSGVSTLIAYVVLNFPVTDFSVFFDKLKSACSYALPEYMVPHYFMALEALPLNANCKVDRNALPMPDINLRKGDYEAPRTLLEKKLVQLWQDLLGVEKVGIRDSFFDLGGHSLIAAQMVTRMRSDISPSVSIKTLFNHPYIIELAEKIEKIGDHYLSLPALASAVPDQPLMLSFAQQRLWFIDQLDHTTDGFSAAYNMPIIWRITGTLDIDAMHRALGYLLDKHKIFRTSIHNDNGAPLVVLVDDIELPWNVFDVSHLANARQAADQMIIKELAKPFDLAKAPLLRALLIAYGREEFTLVINMHHIVTDAWSAGLITGEILAKYDDLTNNITSSSSGTNLQYHDYAQWQRGIWHDGLMQPHEDYWLKVFSEVPAPLQLPVDFPAPLRKNYCGNALFFQFNSEDTQSLIGFARSLNLTPFMVLMGAFSVLLHRYSGQSDIVIGTDTANRTPAETEQIIGYFINQIALKTHIDEQQSVEQWLQTLRDCVINGYEHDVMPLDRLIEKLKIERDLATSPLFQVKLNYHSVMDESLALKDLTIENDIFAPQTVQYDLVLTFKLVGNELLGTLQYRTQLFSEASQLQFIDNYKRLVNGLVAKPKAQIYEIAHQSEESINTILHHCQAWDNFPQHHSLVDRFVAQVMETPAAIALVDQENITYRELNHRSNIVANLLVDRGVKVGDYIALYLERGPQQVIAILAVLKAGAVYVPLDFRSPAERLRLILDDAKPVLMLFDTEALANGVLVPPTASINIDDIDLLDEACDRDFTSRANAILPAYVIYTSGTTGKPNGVMITHAQVARLLDSCQGEYRLGANDVWPFFHSYVFDVSVWEIWGALCFGGRLVTVPYWVSRSPQDFYQLLVNQGVTLLNQTPSAFKQLSSEVLADTNARKNLSSLRCVIFAGEALDIPSLLPWFDYFGDQVPQLFNMYGITETTVHVTRRQITRSDVVLGKNTVGKGVADLDVYILDEQLRVQSPGCPGQLFIGGAGLGLGYLNRPSLTAQRYIPNPFARQPGERLYRSGDLAKWDSEVSNIEYLGRIDQQVQIRGHRVELGEISHVLSSHVGIKECVVVARKDNQDNILIVAFWVPSEPIEISAEKLHYWMSEKVPSYMLPTHFIEIAVLPLTINGKVNVRALPEINLERLTEENYQAPENEDETLLVHIAESLLAIKNIGINHNFFALGGHSLLATQLVSRIRDNFDVNIELKEVFEAPDFRRLAGIISHGREANLAAKILTTNENRTINADREELTL